MKPLKKNRFQLSIFVKILFPILIAIVAIHVIVATTVFPLLRPPHPPHGGPHAGPRSGSERVFAIARKHGSEAEIKNALLSGEDAVFEGKNGNWATRGDLPNWEALAAEPGSRETEREISGFEHGRPFLGKTTEAGRLVIFSSEHNHLGPPSPLTTAPFWWMLMLQVTGILILLYGVLAWQLRPIRVLSDAMSQLSQGHLAHRLTLKDSAEFGKVSDGFNHMAEQITTMLQTKEELLLGVSHELRSPLASVNVLVEMIEDESRREQIRGHLKRMDSLIGELLDSHRITSEHGKAALSTFDVGELITALGARYENTEPGLVIRASKIRMEGDPRLIDRLLSNLVENALKYSQDAQYPVEISMRLDKGDLRIDVADSGPGIPPGELTNVFEPFYRVDKSRNKETGGFGLGLYLCAKIVSFHGGTLRAANRPEGGCCFTVTLPTHQASTKVA